MRIEEIIKTLPLSKGEYPEGGREYVVKWGNIKERNMLNSQYIKYKLASGGMNLLALLPFGALWVISDCLYVLLRHVVGYRKKVVRTNLRNSFPEKSVAELREIERKFYHYLCDYLVSEVKMSRLSPQEIVNRMSYDNLEVFTERTGQGRGIALLIPHYGHYEWLVNLKLFVPQAYQILHIYKPLHNPYIDGMLQRVRSQYGGVNVAKHATVRTVVKMHKEGTHFGVGFITDQSPNKTEAKYWTTFLHQDTVFMDGAEKLAKMVDMSVLYADIHYLRRGYCQVHFDVITDSPKDTADGEITEAFARCLEQTIRRDPPYWFWSHKRWKIKRQ